MKKLLVLVMAMVMAMSVTAFAFAETTCDLSEEDQATVLAAKSAFLGEKVTEGTLSQEQADQIYSDLINQTQNNSLRGLGFGTWLRDSDYADDLEDILSHKNADNGNYTGERPLNGQGYKGGNRN